MGEGSWGALWIARAMAWLADGACRIARHLGACRLARLGRRNSWRLRLQISELWMGLVSAGGRSDGRGLRLTRIPKGPRRHAGPSSHAGGEGPVHKSR